MELYISIIGLILSFFFAGSETAYLSTNPLRLEIWIKNKLKSALLAEKYFKNPDIYLSTTLVGNNLANVIATSYATVYLISYWNETLTWVVITLTILLFGEIIPKVLFRTYAHLLILRIIYLVHIFNFILYPLISLAIRISTFVIKKLRIAKRDKKAIFDKEDIMVMLNEARVSGVVDKEEQKIISRVLNLPDILVREAMVPRTAIHAVEENIKISKIRKLILRTGKTKIPIYKSNIDNIIGVVFMYDLFQEKIEINDIIKPVTYVPDNKKCNELLQEMRQSNRSIAVIIDEYGGTAGIVTIEDLVEELFGEIEETSNKSEGPFTKINKTTWKIRASESIESVNEQLTVKIPEGEYETIAGFILVELGRIPESGEKIALDDCSIMVTSANKTRILEVRLVKKEF